jgi:hypothetical protein
MPNVVKNIRQRIIKTVLACLCQKTLKLKPRAKENFAYAAARTP